MGDPGLRARPEVRRAQRGLAKIVSTRCGGGYQGTGWIAGHGIVVTNAHVVGAAQKVTVSEQGDGPPLAATVIWFDGIHDLALLRVGALRRAPGLPLAADARPSTPAASLGFPAGKLTIRRGQVVATVFAGITQSDITVAVPNRIVRSALRRANHRVELPSCNTPPLEPTRREIDRRLQRLSRSSHCAAAPLGRGSRRHSGENRER